MRAAAGPSQNVRRGAVPYLVNLLARQQQYRCAREEREAAMAICGVITTKEVLRHSATIVREFGAAAYLRCCKAIVMRRRTTFLSCVFAR